MSRPLSHDLPLVLQRVAPFSRRGAVPLAGLLFGSFLWAGCSSPAEDATTPWTWPLKGQAQSVRGTDGVVVSGHPLASQVGTDVLERGGNAIDAAVATGFALAAVLPEAGNLGGGGFLVVRLPEGEVRTLDYREKAPAAASRDMYLDELGEPTDASVNGHLAAGVPGSVAGLWEMHSALGSLPWADLVQPAVELAQGHELDEVRHRSLSNAADRLGRFDGSREQFLPGGQVPAAGSTFAQPDLARTLERIRDLGREGFYTGETADLIVAEMKRGAGLITHQDLLDYTAVWRDPIEIEYRGNTLYSMPPPSSGGVTLAMILNIMEGFDPLPPADSPELLHLQAEAMRRAFVDRNLLLGDPDFVDLPLQRLLSRGYADERRSTIDRSQATPTTKEAFQMQEGISTTHYSIVDRDGMAVAITTTINSSFGSAVTVTGAGFLLNNEMDDFASAPGKPNQFGLVEGEPNAIEPGKRMLSSMTPTILLDSNGDLSLVLGSPGGPTIITSVFQVITRVVDHGSSLTDAVEAPRMHHQALPDRIYFEPDGFSAQAQDRLSAWGHELLERSGHSGDVNAIWRLEDSDEGVADPRRGSGAVAAEIEPEG